MGRLIIGDWVTDAACTPDHADKWFPAEIEGKRSSCRGDDSAAKAVCGRCPVIDACLGWALEHDEPYGVWGGLNQAERKHLQMARKGPQDGRGQVLSPVVIHGGEDGYQAHRRRGEKPCRSCTEGSARAVRERRLRRRVQHDG